MRDVALQVNIGSREAAVAPALIDSLSEYAGTYTTKTLKGADGQQAPQLELAIAGGKTGEHKACLHNARLMRLVID
jgi:hypothetical protein